MINKTITYNDGYYIIEIKFLGILIKKIKINQVMGEYMIGPECLLGLL